MVFKKFKEDIVVPYPKSKIVITFYLLPMLPMLPTLAALTDYQQQEGTIPSKCLSDRKKWWSKMCAKELVVKKSEPLVAGRHGSEVRCELWSDVW